ncbi:MAG: glycosyltransferase family A protein [Cyanobacteria bacterium P01_E01_bin.6]
MPRNEPFSISIVTAIRNRSHLIRTQALASLIQQTRYSFEWIVVNDGGDPATREIVQNRQYPFPHQYVEIEHSTTGFRLCVARNVGLELAKGDLVTYLDEDNSFCPQFIEALDSLLTRKTVLGLVIPQQLRRRDAIVDGHLIRQGTPFVSPTCGTSIADLIAHRALIDSNGLIHPRASAPRWNPSYRIYCDYEYFLRCLQLISKWASPLVLETVLVNYVQSSEGGDRML